MRHVLDLLLDHRHVEVSGDVEHLRARHVGHRHARDDRVHALHLALGSDLLEEGDVPGRDARAEVDQDVVPNQRSRIDQIVDLVAVLVARQGTGSKRHTSGT